MRTVSLALVSATILLLPHHSATAAPNENDAESVFKACATAASRYTCFRDALKTKCNGNVAQTFLCERFFEDKVSTKVVACLDSTVGTHPFPANGPDWVAKYQKALREVEIEFVRTGPPARFVIVQFEPTAASFAYLMRGPGLPPTNPWGLSIRMKALGELTVEGVNGSSLPDAKIYRRGDTLALLDEPYKTPPDGRYLSFLSGKDLYGRLLKAKSAELRDAGYDDVVPLDSFNALARDVEAAYATCGSEIE